MAAAARRVSTAVAVLKPSVIGRPRLASAFPVAIRTGRDRITPARPPKSPSSAPSLQASRRTCLGRKPGRRVVREGLDNLLRRPSRGRGVGHVEMYDSAAVMEEDYEHVEHAERRRRGHDEEVDRDKIGDVIFEEGPPGLRGRFRTARHEPTNRAL